MIELGILHTVGLDSPKLKAFLSTWIFNSFFMWRYSSVLRLLNSMLYTVIVENPMPHRQTGRPFSKTVRNKAFLSLLFLKKERIKFSTYMKHAWYIEITKKAVGTKNQVR